MIKSALQSSLTNDVKYRNLAGSNVPSNEYLIQTLSVDSAGVTSLEFTNLNQHAGIYRHLFVRFVVRDTRATNGGNYILVRVNGGAGSYYSHRLIGVGSGFSTGADTVGTSAFYSLVGLSANDATGAFSAGTFDILDAFHLNKNKVMKFHFGYNGGDSRNYLTSGLWESTAAISSITFTPDAGAAFAVGTSFSIYGVTA